MALIAAKCPTCGAGLDVPEGHNAFYCAYCGQEIVVECNAPNITATTLVGPDVNNLIDLAEMAESSGNNAEAHKYWSQVLERDTKNVSAWIGKGLTAGWQSTLAVPRIAESINCLRKAISLQIESDQLRKKAAVGGHGVAVAFYNLALGYRHEFQHNTAQHAGGLLDLVVSSIEDSAKNRVMDVEFANRVIASLDLSSMVWRELDKTPQMAIDIAAMCQELLRLNVLAPGITSNYQSFLAAALAWREAQTPNEVSRHAKETRAASSGICGRCLRRVVLLPKQIDCAMRNGIGQDNTIIYRFLQILFYVAVPTLIGATLFIRWLK